jgi:exonuclease III
MAYRARRPLRIIAFNVNGLARQCCKLSKQLQELHKDVCLLSETETS